MGLKKQIVYKRLDEITPYEKNPRKNDEAVKYVKNSIKTFKFQNPIILDVNGVIVCGHTRYLAAKQLGMKEVPCVIADDLTEEQIRAFRIADNKTAEKAEWDFELLSEELEELFDFDMSEFGFDFNEQEEEAAPKPEKDLSGDVHETFEVIVECANELQQEEIYYKLTKEGLNCRVLTL